MSGENEFGRLFQGFEPKHIEGMDILEWTTKDLIPKSKKITYPQHTVANIPEKDEVHLTRITCGGDCLDYFGDVTTHTASMETIKYHWNSVLYTPNAKYCTGDISNMYLMSLLPDAEYIRFQFSLIPPRIVEAYKLVHDNGFTYAKIKKAWYGLNKQGKLLMMTLSNTSRKVDSLSPSIPNVYSITPFVIYHPPWLSMISASNIQMNKMSNI